MARKATDQVTTIGIDIGKVRLWGQSGRAGSMVLTSVCSQRQTFDFTAIG
jgi:hypothetical protein